MRTRVQTISWLLLLLFAGTMPVSAQQNAAQSSGGYKIGQTLPAAGKSDSDYRLTRWADLLPSGWKPADVFKGMDIARLQDSDPRATDALARMREQWDKAPVEPRLNGAAIRIAGFAIPIERSHDSVRELLLVPYFGACIHVPPPPANQIIDVVLDKPIKNMSTMDTIWVNGILSISQTDTDWGRASYRMRAKYVEPYVMPESK